MPDTICAKFLEAAQRDDDRPAILFPIRTTNGVATRWLELSWANYLQIVAQVAAGFVSLGAKKQDRIAILSSTRVEWAYCDLAILGIGAVTVPIYHNSTVEDITHILNDSGAQILICESVALARKLNLSASIKVVVLEPIDSGSESESFLGFEQFQEKGEREIKRDPKFFETMCLKTKTEDVATILYTSGTTGNPKGVVLTHEQILSEVSEAFPLLGVTLKDRTLCFLPFAHILGRIELWGHVMIGFTMAYAESIERLKDNLVRLQPTVMISVPRIFEKIHDGILAQAEISRVRKKIFDWSMSIGRQISQYKLNKRPVPLEVALQYQVAKRLVFDKLAEKLGGQLRFAVCGGAPLSPQIAEFFHAAGLLILEGYGLTETTAAITVNTPFDYRFGTVGKPIGDVRIKIAEDGEILTQSKKVMKEYYHDSESTAASIKNGWFHTGDIGELTSEGYLRITDRKKDLIKTAGGKYVAPQKLEGLLKTNPYISQVHIHGDQEKYIVALVTLNMEAIRKFAQDQDLSYKDPESLCQNPKVRELIRKAVAEANGRLASFESIKNFAILPNEFTIESGELTPSLKVKRKVVDKNYHELIVQLYGVKASS